MQYDIPGHIVTRVKVTLCAVYKTKYIYTESGSLSLFDIQIVFE